ncbi:bifunctional molybdenum cofactor biosynthesis protein MoaC/MoaB [Bdellovibrio sp.]|uniref:bifunctional molybdenum cofactor biosynthesis protein MoaC/MoaB n=1 Tax=Bdellovibrio sp. TaxID=28201 RepID=UPI0039E4203F
MATCEHYRPMEDDVSGSYNMIDVSEKVATERKALATGKIYIQSGIIRRIVNKDMPKGDVLALAEVAGIMAAKNTSQILPLCHPLLLESVKVRCLPAQDHIEVQAQVKCQGKTGVEMEALCAVNAALLCIYDLTKIVEPEMTLGEIQLLRKEGGKSGVWEPRSRRQAESCGVKPSLEGISSAVLTLSDRCFAGTATDSSGPVIVDWLTTRGAQFREHCVLSDDKEGMKKKILEWRDQGVALVILTGGTGLSPRDNTPEALLEIADREVPGFGELLRMSGAKYTPMSYLSRSITVLVGATLVVSLPGSAKAVTQGLQSLEGLLPHAIHISQGKNHGGSHVHDRLS